MGGSLIVPRRGESRSASVSHWKAESDSVMASMLRTPATVHRGHMVTPVAPSLELADRASQISGCQQCPKYPRVIRKTRSVAW